jgi:hypothetical protein
LKRLLHPDLPDDLIDGEIYTFRWKLSDWAREYLPKAEGGGYNGMWVEGERFELVKPTEGQ